LITGSFAGCGQLSRPFLSLTSHEFGRVDFLRSFEILDISTAITEA
jgi:hypothetical protein